MGPKLRTFLTSLIFPVFLALYGCASQGDLETLQRDTNNTTKELLALQRNLYDMNTEMKNISGKLEDLGKKSDDLQQQMASLNAETRTKIGFMEKQLETSSQPMRRYQADLGARIDQLQMDVQNLTGRFEESKYFAQKTFGETKTLKESYQGKLDELEKRIAALNKNVEDLEKKGAVVEAQAKPAEGAEAEKVPLVLPVPTAKPEPSKGSKKVPEKTGKKPIPAPEEAYNKASELFKKGEIEQAKVGS